MSSETVKVSLENLEDMTQEAKILLAVKFRSQGETVDAIARKFEVTDRTVYNWFAIHRNKYIEELEQLKHIDVFTDQLQILHEYEQSVLRVANRLQMDLANPQNTSQKLKGRVQDFVSLMRLASSLREQQINLHQFAGTLPKQPERIYHTIADATSKTGENKDDISKMPREDLEKLTLKRLQDQLIL